MVEDFNKLRQMNHKLVHTEFQRGWQFRVECTDQPTDFDIFVKDISYGPTEIETEQDKAGHVTMTWPVGSAPVTVTMTVRDHQDRRVSDWFNARCKKVVNPDGTVNLPEGPDGYLLEFRRFSLLDNNSEQETNMWKMLPTQLGDVTESVEEPGFLEFPLTFIQFRS